MLTCPRNGGCNTSHFYIVILGFTGVYRGIHYFLIFALKIVCGYSLTEAVLTYINNVCLEQK